MTQNQIYLIGRMPPPFGGVTSFNVQVQDLFKGVGGDMSHVKSLGRLLSLVNPKEKKNILVSISNRFAILIATMVLKLFGHNVAIVIHGDIERGNKINAHLAKGIAFFSNYTIVLNNSSYQYLGSHPKVLCLGTNLAPDREPNNSVSNSNKKTCVTYASRKKTDLHGREIYGIGFLYSFFSKIGRDLIILDPSNDFEDLESTEHIQIHREPVQVSDFVGADFIYIRNTSTDGDSLLVHEAMNAGSVVIASNVVSRPPGVLLMNYNSESQLKKQLDNAVSCTTPKPTSHHQEWADFLLHFCKL